MLRLEHMMYSGALRELEATCAAVNAHASPTPWSLHQEERTLWIGPAQSSPRHRIFHPQAEGRIVAFTGLQVFGRDVVTIDEATLQADRGHLTLAAPGPRRCWTFERDTARIGGILNRDHQSASRYQGSGSLRSPQDTDMVDFVRAFCFDRAPKVVSADGTRDLTLTKGTVDSVQPLPSTHEDADFYDHTFSVRSLHDRWDRLPTDADRLHVATYWLGHPHPVLAELGMTLFPQVTHATTRPRHA
jgi:hypothetical protein